MFYLFIGIVTEYFTHLKKSLLIDASIKISPMITYWITHVIIMIY